MNLQLLTKLKPKIYIPIISIFLLGGVIYYVFGLKNEVVYSDYYKPKRGNILADNGTILSSTDAFYELRIDFQHPALTEALFAEHIDSLSHGLAILFKNKTKEEYLTLLRRGWVKRERYYLIQRNIPSAEYEVLKTMPLVNLGRKCGIIFEKKEKRIRALGEIASKTIGTHIIESNWHYYHEPGLEGDYEEYLNGIDSIKSFKAKYRRHTKSLVCINKVLYKLFGKYIPYQKVEQVEFSTGEKSCDIVTTLNPDLQKYVHNTLLKAAQESNADYATAIVMEVATGDIKAITNLTQNSDGVHQEMYKENPSILANNLIELPLYTVASNAGINQDGYNFSGNKFTRLKEILEQEKRNNYDTYYRHLELAGLKPPVKLNRLYSSTGFYNIKSNYFCSAIHLLTLFNSYANNGRMVYPRFVSEIMRGESSVKEIPICNKELTVAPPSVIAKVQDQLKKGSVAQITDQIFYTETHIAAGWQGTTIGYWPADNPKYSCLVMIKAPEKTELHNEIWFSTRELLQKTDE